MENQENHEGKENRLKYRLAILTGAAGLAVVLIICMLFWGFSRRPAAEESRAPVSSAAVEESVPAQPSRTLGVWEGKLALYLGVNPVPDEVFDVFIATLPEEEQERLRKGIPIANDTELALLLEDYTS